MSSALFLVWMYATCALACYNWNVKETLPPSCDSPVYCQGNLLHTVQMARLQEDSKLFVDKSMVNDVSTTLDNFNKMMDDTDQNPTTDQIQAFVDENFLSEGELDDWIPSDFVEEPSFLSKIVNEEFKEFAKNLVAIWKELGRKVKEEVYENPEQHSLIYVPNGFIIPGGRFLEYYYWDSYWIIEGLLACGMTDTVKGMIDNFLSLVSRYGHIPNGGRVYYAERSQPPLLSQMAKRYYEETNDIDWLKSSIDILEKEVEFWTENRIVDVEISGTNYQVGVYHARSAGPRPESYYEDYMTAGIYTDEDDKNELYIQLKSGAESGWDFTSRWIFDENGGTNANISYINTSRVAPVDLNSFLYQAFTNLALFFSDLNDIEKQVYWQERAILLNETINQILWNEDDGTWYDFDLQLLAHRKHFSAANLAPLWAKAFNNDPSETNVLINRVIDYLKKEGAVDFLGGLPITLINTGEQWDFPNAWPPYQSIIINGLAESGVEEGKLWAKVFAERWITANIIGFNETGYMFEKYDAENAGQYGGGGEYNVQRGFGWTNGVVLELLNKYFTE